MVCLGFSQELLRLKLKERIQASGVVFDDSALTQNRIADAFRSISLAAEEMVVVVVLRDFVPQVFAESCMDFVLGLDVASRQGWFRSFTRTIYLAGNPNNLVGRFSFRQLAKDGSIAWSAPAPFASSFTLRRLLSSFQAKIPDSALTDFETVVPAARLSGKTKILYVGVAGLTGADYLIHLNHTLSEGILTGAISPGDRVLVRAVPSVNGYAQLANLRVHVDLFDGRRLRAYAGISDCWLAARSSEDGST
jgi:hypothetical protein